MSLFDVDYINVVYNLLLPPYKRITKWLAWGNVMMAAKQWWHNSIFTTWAQGDADAAYSNSTTYYSGNRVIYSLQAGGAYYGDNAVYEALCINADGTINVSGFSGVPPTGNAIVPGLKPATVGNSTQALAWLYALNPTNPGCLWIRVSPNFIGANERVSYNAQKLLFEYALNRWFGTTFKQPSIGVSDIYISQLDDVNNDFYGAPDQGTYFGYQFTDATPKYGMPTNVGGISPYDFIINVPTAVYNALSASASQREGIVRAFADKINAAGMLYEIVTY